MYQIIFDISNSDDAICLFYVSRENILIIWWRAENSLHFKWGNPNQAPIFVIRSFGFSRFHSKIHSKAIFEFLIDIKKTIYTHLLISLQMLSPVRIWQGKTESSKKGKKQNKYSLIAAILNSSNLYSTDI